MTKKLFWKGVFVFVAVLAGVGLSIKPWQIYRQQRAIADKAIVDMNEAEKSRAELTRQKAKAEGTIGREELARQQGYRQANETPVDLNR